MNTVTIKASTNPAHAYEVEIGESYETIKVLAKNSLQAVRAAENAGYIVRSVNMVG